MPRRWFGYAPAAYDTPTRRSAPIQRTLLIGAEALERRLLLSGAVQLFVTSDRGNTVGEYTTSGATVNASLISGLGTPQGVAVSGSDVFVSNTNSNTIGEYTTSGATVNASLITGLSFPQEIAISGSDLFVANSTSGTVGEYTTSGATVNAALISGLSGPIGIAVSGSDLFVTNTNISTIGEYTTAGATVNATLISGLFEPEAIALSGPNLFVTNNSGDSIGEYTTNGATVNATLIQGISNLFGIAVSGSDLFFANYTAGTIYEYTTAGVPVNTSLVTGLNDPLAIAVSPSGQAASPPGSADPTFNGGNPVNVGFAAQASVVLPGGQTLLAGIEPGGSAGSTQAVLEELNADGSIDSSFGSAGTVTDSATSDEVFNGVVAESSGTIVAVGASGGDLLLAGYNPDGSVDTSFGVAGRVTVPIAGATDAAGYGITTDASGNIAVVGSAGGQFLADRFTANGVQDPAFNGGAPLLFGTASNGDVLGNVAVQSNGGIVAAGASAGSIVVVRLTSGGALDSTFGAAGVVTLSQLAAPDLLPGQPDHTEGLTIDSEGRILVANTSPGSDFATARLTPAGSLDTTFGGGVVTTDFGGTDDADFVAVQPDGSQIIVAGTSAVGGVVQEAIAAYTPAGLLDTSFGNGIGKELLPISVGAAPALLHRPSRQPGPQAEGGGTILQEAFGSLVDGKLVLGLGKQSPATASAAVQRFVAPAPTATPLPVGTLTASISASIPTAVVGGSKAKASAVVTVSNPGSQAISGPVRVTLYVSLGQSLGGAVQLVTSTPRLKLKAHARKAVRFKLSAFPSLPMGSYYLVASVSAPDGTSSGAAGPSLTISPAFVSTVVSNVVPALAPVAPGEKTSLALSLQNQGNVPATGTASVSIAASDEPSGNEGGILATLPLKVRLKPGRLGRYKLRFAVPSSLPAGRYYLALAVNVAALGDSIASDGMAVSTLTLTVT